MKYHFVYRTHNIVDGKEYTGKHSTDDLDDGYYGSGLSLNAAVRKYGIENFVVEILSFHDSSDAALNEEARIVDEEYVDREDTYNLTLGGFGSWYHLDTSGMCVVKDRDGNTMHVSVDDPRYVSGELVHIATGTICVIDSNENRFRVSINDPRYISGKLRCLQEGTFTAKDTDGNTFRIRKDDPRYISGELVHHNKGKYFPIKNIINITCPHCEKTGRPTNMKRWHFDKCKQNPNRIEYDSLTCPHCGKIGTKANMKRWHFDNCKFK